jgi:hypothetical protein
MIKTDLQDVAPEEFAAAVTALIEEAKAQGSTNDTVLTELEDIISLLREGLL